MAPVLNRHVTPRDPSTGKTFSVVFAVIAFLVVAICVLWGYFIPKWRFKYRRPSSTRFNCIGGAAKYGPDPPPRTPAYVPHFPSHPGVRGRYKPSSLPIYNPRTESPFGNNPRNGEVVHLRRLTPTPTATTRRKALSTRKRPTHDYELPKTPGTLSQLALTGSLRGLGLERYEDSEPPKRIGPPIARPAGRAPPLTKQLALFPTPVSNPNEHFEPLAHPNLLFEKLDQLDSRKVPPSLDGRYIARSTFASKGKKHGDGRRNTTFQNAGKAKSEIAEMSGAGIFGGSAGQRSGTQNIPKPCNAVPNPIHKYKPKTPVGNIRDGYGRFAGGVRFIPPRKTSLQRHMTPSTEPLTGSASVKSKFAVLTTPPTSHPPINDPTLIPTPLRVRRAAARAAAASPTPVQATEKHYSPSESSMAISFSKLTPFSLQNGTHSKRQIGKSTGVYYPKPTLGSAVTKSKPFRIKRSSWRSSSVYSRNTRGMSILRSPKFLPKTNTEGGKRMPLDALSPRRANSMDLVRSKIDDWNLHTGHLQLPSSPSLDRPQSDVGPRSPPLRVETNRPAPIPSLPKEDVRTTFGLTMPIPKIYVGRPSDDVFGDGGSTHNSGRVLRRVFDMEMASAESKVSKYYGRTAPGGAEWI